jgi:hypothetical protein
MNSDSNSEIAALRGQLFIQLVALVVVTGTLTVYLYRQASTSYKQITEANRIISEYQQNEPTYVKFVNELVVYGQQDPNFAQKILKKYGIVGPVGGANGSAQPQR